MWKLLGRKFWVITSVVKKGETELLSLLTRETQSSVVTQSKDIFQKKKNNRKASEVMFFAGDQHHFNIGNHLLASEQLELPAHGEQTSFKSDSTHRHHHH